METKTKDDTADVVDVRSLLDECIFLPYSIQEHGIIWLIVDDYLEYGDDGDDAEIMRRGLGYLHNTVCDINNGLDGACYGGYLELVELMISKGADDWTLGLYRACEGGHLKIVELMISKGVDYRNGGAFNVWNGGLFSACGGGHLELAELMISKGANDWNWGLRGACIGGHVKLVELMISKGVYDWNRGLHGACLGGHFKFVELMISKGANDWLEGLHEACRGNHLELVQLMTSKGIIKYDIHRCLSTHWYTSNTDIIAHLESLL